MSLMVRRPSRRRVKATVTQPKDWKQIYTIYGIDQWQTLVFLLLHALLFSSLAFFFLLYFVPITTFLHACVSFLSLPTIRFLAGIFGSVVALSAACLLFAAGNFAHSAVTLRYEMAQVMVRAVGDWSSVRSALDVGCHKGILLNSVATQLKKSGSSGRVVGLDRSKPATLATLRTAYLEGVGEYVTCREGDMRSLPFGDNYFDVVVSALYIHTVGKEYGRKTVEAAAERMRVLGEMVRVLKPGGTGVVWDLVNVPEYARRLQEMKMEGITLSERVTAFMVGSHVVSFRKPSFQAAEPGDVRLDWRF